MNFLLSIARFILYLYFFLYALVHLLLLITPETARYLIFMNYMNWPMRDLQNPPKYEQHNVHNFYLDVEPKVRVGVWHFIPAPLEYNFSADSKKNLKEHFETYFKVHDKRPVVIYVHGNDRDRSDYGRMKLCQSLAGLGYHVFAIDYRGFGDSTGTPSETGCVNDVLELYNFVKAIQKESKIFLWGHSLGTGISSHAAKILSDFKSPPAGVVLEAPFYNISQAAKEYIISPLFLNNPWIIRMGDEALQKLNIHFNNAENILKTKSKILILHAEDDMLIPQDRSRDLIKICNQKRPQDYPPVKLVEFHKRFGLGHAKIYTHKELYPVIKEFIEN
ncbi:abhydrolase domain-containing 12B [Brachionus plicatilis]|uniref:Abhydrolase domain-containing 12B n=1 Tax=Brachionus plicatilis TaxID=10195 RepID=A0A3M7TAN4_BRAPC|nr:abhydrolase domain-containing 12B [Brachionus plicatilis]